MRGGEAHLYAEERGEEAAPFGCAEVHRCERTPQEELLQRHDALVVKVEERQRRAHVVHPLRVGGAGLAERLDQQERQRLRHHVLAPAMPARKRVRLVSV
eukprot:8528365-Pyramimonas_sp.AAC.1